MSIETQTSVKEEIQISKLYATHIRPPSSKKRGHAVHQVLKPRLSEEHDQELVQNIATALVLPSTDYLWDRASQQKILELIESLNQTDAETVLKVLINYSPKTTTSEAVCLQMLCKLFVKTQTESAKVFSKLLSWSINCLYARFDADFHELAQIHEIKPVIRLLFSKSELLSTYLDSLSSQETKFVGLQLLFFHTTPAQIQSLDKEKIHKIFSDMVLEYSGFAKEQIKFKRSSKTYSGFSYLFSFLDASDLAQIIIKAFNRSRENTAPLLVIFAANITLNDSLYQLLLPCIFELLGNSKDVVERQMGTSLFVTLSKVSLESLSSTLEKLLISGGLGAPEKISTLEALRQAVTKQVPASIVKTLVSVISSSTESDASRAEACETVYQCCLKDAVFEQVSSLVSALDVAAFCKQDAVRAKALKALGNLLKANQQAFTKELSDKLCQLVVKSEQKVVERLLALYALRALLYAITGSSNKNLITEVVNKQKAVSTKVVDFLLTQETVTEKLVTFDDHLVFAQVTECFVLNYPQHVGLGKKDSENKELFLHLVAAVTIGFALATSQSDVQQLINIVESIQKDEILGTMLFGGFISLVDAKFYRDMRFVSSATEENEDLILLRVTNALNHALFLVAPKCGEQISKEYVLNVFAKILHYAHHPDVRDNTRVFFKFVEFKVSNKDILKSAVVEHKKDIINHLITNVLLKQEEGESLRSAIGYALSALINLFITKNTVSLLKENKARVHQHTIQQDTEATQQHAVIEEIYSQFSEQFLQLYNEFFEFDDEDIDVFYFEKSDEKPVFHDVERELSNNPMFQPEKREPTKYELTNEEWQQIFKQEDDMKKKNKSLNTETIRKKLISEKIQEKEEAMKEKISNFEDRLIKLSSGLSTLIDHSSNTSRFLQHSVISLVVINIAKCMEIELTEDLANAVGDAYHTLCTKLCTPHAYSFLTADLIARLTFRLKRYESRTLPRTLRGRNPEVDDDVVFAEFVMNHLKISIRRNVDAESFSILVPLLQNVLHGEVLQLKGQIKAGKITVDDLKKPMLILTAHVGLEGIRSGVIRPVCCKILVEVLKSFPSLNKQADSAVLSMAQFLTPEDIDPLLDGLLAEQSNVRFSILKALNKYPAFADASSLEAQKQLDIAENPRLMHLLYLTQFDTDAGHQEQIDLGKHLWATYEQRYLKDKPEKEWATQIQESLFEYLGYQEQYVKHTNAVAFVAICKQLGANTDIHKVLEDLFASYTENKHDHNVKLSVALILERLTSLLTSKQHIETLFKFLIDEGLRDAKVQDEMVKVGMSLVNNQGKQFQDVLLNLFNSFLEKGQAKPQQVAKPQPVAQPANKKGGKPATPVVQASAPQPEKSKWGKASDDYVLGSVVVFMGTLASFYPASEHQKTTQIAKRLFDALKIQSESVQRAVSESLAGLLSKFVTLNAETQKSILQPMIDELLVGLVNQTSTFGERKGFSYGLAGIVSGIGIGALKQYDVMTRLRQVFSKKMSSASGVFPDPALQGFAGQPTAREGVLIAYELLAKRVKTFEPYFIEIIPQVLDGLADSASPQVRQAAQDAANSIMGKLSGHGVRIILPHILQTIKNDGSDDWRVKSTSLQLLGAMAYVSPRQLAEYLPVVVKTLTEAVLTDTHPEVQQSGVKALERVGGVVQNPEIVQVVPQLLQALTQPTTPVTDQVLEGLLYTRFLHSIDAASLALVVPVVCRALKERNSETKRKGAQIVGSISNLTTNPSDLLPYVTDLVPLLQSGIVDPQPLVRQSCAKAVGVLARSLGEQRLSTMMDWLHQNMGQNSYSSVERSGAAQTMSEIIAAQGVTRLQQLLPSLLGYISKPNPAHVRQGYMQVFVYLPALMKSKFEPYLTEALPRILEGLSDNDEDVRATALNSSKVIVELYATSAIAMLIPALINGLQSIEYRIRESTLMLLTEFLRRISKQYEDERKPKQEEEVVEESDDEDEETESTEQTKDGEAVAPKPKIPQILIERDIVHLDVVEKLVGKPALDQLVALMFILQYDSHLGIKSKAKSIWKSSVSNTSKMLRTILHTLIATQVKLLASQSEELRDQAASSMSETVAKVGEKVLSDIIPMLHDNLVAENSNKDTRFGACIGLKELLQTSSERSITQHQKKLMVVVRRAVCDPDLDVQQAGSEIFDALFRILGSKIVNELLSQLFVDLKKEGEDKRVALAGLQQLLRVRGQALLAKIIPIVIDESGSDVEITESNAQILAAVIESSGSYIVDYIPKIVSPLIKQAGKKLESKAEDTHLKALAAVLQKIAVAVPEEELEELVPMYVQALSATKVPVRLGGCFAVQCFFEGLVEAEAKASQQQAQPAKKKQVAQDEEDEEDEDEEEEGLFGKYVPQLLESVLHLYMDGDTDVVKGAVRATLAIAGGKNSFLKPDDYADFIGIARNAIREMTSNTEGTRVVFNMPGFDAPNGLDSLLAMFIHGLTTGKTPELREQSALGLGDLVELTSAKALTATVVMKMIGALIRIVGERFPWQVKAAILNTMSLLLEKCGPLLKAFLPQLQTTFIKSLQDTNVEVRSIGAQALGKLVAQPGARIDAIINELHTALKQMMQKKQNINMDNQLQGVLLAMLMALEFILKTSATATMPKQEASLEPLLATLIQLLQMLSTSPFGFDASSVDMRTSVAQRLSTLAHVMNNANKIQTDLIEGEAFKETDIDERVTQARLLLIAALITNAPQRILQGKNLDPIQKLLVNVKNQATCPLHVRQASMQVAMSIILSSALDNEDIKSFCIQLLNHFLANSSDNSVRYEAVKVIKQVCKKSEFKDPLLVWVKTLLFCTKDKYVPIKLASERTLMYLFNLHQQQQHIAKQYAQTCQDPEEQKILKDYILKVAKNLETEDSDQAE